MSEYRFPDAKHAPFWHPEEDEQVKKSREKAKAERERMTRPLSKEELDRAIKAAASGLPLRW